jgi:TonB-linked SusC/RagA family outer membrane protein
MKMFKYILPLLLLFTAGEVLGQRIVSGTVSEMINGKKERLVGVNVVFANSQNRFLTGVATGASGEFSLKVPEGEGELNLTFSFIGMKTQSIKYTGQKTLDLVMESDQVLMDEVTVVGSARRNDMGLTDRQVISATQRIRLDDIMAVAPVSSVDEALQGRLGGVDIILGGDPGSRSAIRIRGTSSLNASSEPLIVIDGVPRDQDIDADFEFATASEEDFGALLNINPADIENIEVLKDASATAIWGSKGANGVLLITTKKGAKGPTTFTLSSKFTVKQEPNTIPMLNGNQYVAMMQDAIWNTANAKGIAFAGTEMDLLFNTPELNYNPGWIYFDEYNQNTKWLNEVRSSALTSDNNFSMSGGGDKAIYRFSLGYLYEGGTSIGTALRRLSSSLNINYFFSDQLRVDADFSYSQSDRDDNYHNARSEALKKMPNKSPYWIDDETGRRTPLYFSPVTDFQGAYNGSDHFNPVAMAKESYNTTMGREAKMNFRLNYKILSNLTYVGLVSMTIGSTKNQKFLPQSATGVVWTSEYFNRSADLLSDKMSIVTDNKLLFTKNWNDKHELVATAVFKTSSSNSSSYSSQTYGNSSPSLADPTSGGKVVSMGSGTSKSRKMTTTLNLNYTLMNRYVFSGNVNMEGNSSMGNSNRFGVFDAFGVAWLAHEEDFLKEVSWLESAKIRVGYGQSGTSPGGSAPYIGTFRALTPGYIDNSAIEPVRIQLDKLKWETSTEYNVGTDISVLNRKLYVTFDWYTRKKKDLLQKDIDIPSSTGFSEIRYFNSGEMSNWGLEFRVEYEAFRNKDWLFTINANVSKNVNKIDKLPDNMKQEQYEFKNGQYAQRVIAGNPVGSFYGYRYEGVYQNSSDTYARDRQGNVMMDLTGVPINMKNGSVVVAPGDAKYEDVNGDGIINQYDIVYLGNAMPLFIGGGGFSLKYKEWLLTAFFHGRVGQKVINSARMTSEAMYGKDNQSTAVLKRWRNEGDDTDIPRALYNYGYNYLGSDRFVENASFLRFKTLSLNYTVPKRITSRWGINRLDVFVTAYDLFTWTDYTGQDPEVSLPSGTGLVQDKAQTPKAIRSSFGIKLNF